MENGKIQVMVNTGSVCVDSDFRPIYDNCIIVTFVRKDCQRRKSERR